LHIGRGSGIVIATGEETEFGVIFSMMQEVCSCHRVSLDPADHPQVEERRTPLQLSMDELAEKLSLVSFGIIGVICLIGVLQQRSWLDMFTIGGALPLHSNVFFINA
jgi:Ca2+-transporting ATPase